MTDEMVLPEIVSVNDYNVLEGKLAASVRWLITRVFERDVPDMLQNAVARDDEGRLQLTTSILTALTNGSLYGQAASRILRDPSFVQKRPSAVLETLERVGTPVAMRDVSGGWERVTETHLMSAEPFVQMAHIAMIDTLMSAHVRNAVSIDRAIDAVLRYTTVDDQERPVDPTDALLFWINKICLLVRDDVEKRGHPLKGGVDGMSGTIPEMEDLYEDLCDGCCLAALLSFYRPDMISMNDICFNDPMSVPDCQYNLLLVERFCSSALPHNVWHFETEDVLYMHEWLQTNVNCFLSELFEFLEPIRQAESEEELEEGRVVEQEEDQQAQADAATAAATAPRRFVPIQGIADLRAANLASRSPHPPKVRYQTLPRQQPPRSMSVMSSDSLMNAKSPISLSARLAQEQQWGGNVTDFGHLQEANVDAMGNGGVQHQAVQGAGSPGGQCTSGGATYSRSDSLPIASIRLALEEKRREHEKRKALQSTMSESERAEKGKAAFFALMSKHGGKNSNEPSPAPNEAQQQQQQQPGIAANNDNAELVDTLNRQLNDLREKVERMNMEREGERMSRATSQPSIYQDVNGSPMPVSQASAVGSARGTPHPTSAGAIPPFSHSAGHYAQPLPYGGAPSMNDYYFSPPPQQQQGHAMQAQFQTGYETMPQFHAMRPSLSNGVLNYMSPPQPQQQQQQPPMHYDPAIYAGQAMPQQQMHQQMQSGANYYGMQQQQQPQYVQQQPNIMHQSAHGSFSLHRPPSTTPLQQPQQPPIMQHQQQMPVTYSHIAPPPQYDEATMAAAAGQAENHHGGTFRLHTQNAAASRLDPPLELNRNLTNWGLTWHANANASTTQATTPTGLAPAPIGSAGGRPARRTWENETFIKSEHDLVNQPEHVPCAPPNDEEVRPPSLVGSFVARSSRSREDTPASGISVRTDHSNKYGSESERPSQSSPPRDPSARGGTREPSPGALSTVGNAFVVDDDGKAAEEFDKIAEERRVAKQEAILAKMMKRKEESALKVVELEQKDAERRAMEMAKQEMAERRKMEKEIQRQKILDEYKRRKLEKEMGMETSRSLSNAGGASRGHSQPPFVRTKSQVAETPRTPSRARGMSSVEDPNRIFVPSTAEPTLKLFSKAQPKSNRGLITNALQFSIFPGAVSNDSKNKVLGELAKSDSKHFLLLFRDQKCQYRGLYSWDQQSDTALKISGTGPKICKESMMKMMFKYDSGAKSFSIIPTKHLSATIDGFSLQDQYWMKPKIPHSGAPGTPTASHRDN